jgi:AcrR family transcriptional regulator
VSVETIAEEADTTKVTLYRVFSSKEDLVVQVLEDHIRRFWQWWDSVIAPFEGQPRKQIEVLIASFEEGLCSDEAERGCPVANTAVEIVEDDHPAKKIIHDHEAEISRRLHALCHEMGARRPEQLGDALTLLISGVFAARLLSGNTQQIASASAAAQALLESPSLGIAPRAKA